MAAKRKRLRAGRGRYRPSAAFKERTQQAAAQNARIQANRACIDNLDMLNIALFQRLNCSVIKQTAQKAKKYCSRAQVDSGYRDAGLRAVTDARSHCGSLAGAKTRKRAR